MSSWARRKSGLIVPQANFIPGMRPGFVAANKPLAVFCGSFQSETANQRTYSASIDLGDPHPSRLIVVATVCVTGTGEQLTASVDGAATNTAASSAPPAGVIPTGIFYVANALGGTVTVQIDKPGGADMDRADFAVWSVYHLKSHTPTNSATDGVGATVDPNVTTLQNGVVIGCAGTNIAGTLSVSGLDVDFVENTGNLFFIAGSRQAPLVLTGTHNISFSTTGVALNSGCAASWR